MRLLLAFLTFGFLTTAALAQQPQHEITLKLSTNDVQEIWTALGERPAKFSGPVMSRIQEQIGKQTKPPEPSATPQPAQPDAKK